MGTILDDILVCTILADYEVISAHTKADRSLLVKDSDLRALVLRIECAQLTSVNH